jgi:hypothetical protein
MLGADMILEISAVSSKNFTMMSNGPLPRLIPLSGTGTQVWLLKSVLLRDLDDVGREELSDSGAMALPSLSRKAILSPMIF